MITITKDKIYRSTFSLKKTKPNSEDVKEIDVRDIIFSMGEDVELGEDVTFGRIFEIVIFHKEFFNILFNAEMDGLVVEDFIHDYEQEFREVIPYQEYNLQIYWDTMVYEIGERIEYYDCVGFEAFGKIDTRIDGEGYSISIELTSLSQIKDRFVVLDNTFEIEDDESFQDGLEPAFKANYRPFSVSNVFGGILHTITRYGKPEDRDKSRQEAEKKNLEINQWINDGTIYDRIMSHDIRDDIKEMIDEEHPDDDNITFWDILYPKEKPIGKSTKEIMDDAIIAMSESAELSLEEQLREADESEDYERAAKIKKLIDKRDAKKNKK